MKGKIMNKRTQQGNETKKRIIDCARKLFVEKGYNNVSVDEIISEAGSSKGGFYTHFKTKEQLIFSMVGLVDEAYLKFSESERRYKNTTEQIYALMEYVFEFMEKEVGLDFMSVIYSSQIKDQTTNRFLISPEREYYRRLKILTEEGQKNGELSTEFSASEIVAILTTCARGVIYDWCLKEGAFQLRLYGMKVIGIVLNQFKL